VLRVPLVASEKVDDSVRNIERNVAHPEERRRRVSKGVQGGVGLPCFETPLRGSSA
jgi:hypothetical protein